MKMPILPKLMYGFMHTNQNPSRIILFVRYLSKSNMGRRRNQNNHTVLDKKSKVVGLTLSDFNSYYKTTEIRTG